MPPEQSLVPSGDLWPAITKAAKTAVGRVAVAYLGRDAPRLLPLLKGSVLVCDFSTSALKRGLTHPDAVRAFLNAGVEVHSCEGLHAKVFAFGQVAFVGSCNASANSESALVEAAIKTTDARVIREVGDFVMSLRGIRIGPEYVNTVEKLYREPEWQLAPIRRPAKRPTPFVPLWIADVSEASSQEADRVAGRSRKDVQRLVPDQGAFDLDWFEWKPGVPAAIAQHPGEIMMIHDDGGGPHLYPPARYLLSEKLPGSKSHIVWVEVPRSAPSIPLKVAIKRLGSDFGKRLKEISVSREIRHREFSKSLRQLW